MVHTFVADGMLGRLAKWLRIMGYDTHYQPFYQEPVMNQCIKEGRLLISRNRSITENYTRSFLLRTGTVRDQLYELRDNSYIESCRSMWLTRCLICNLPLKKTTPESARNIIPDYVFNQNYKDLSFCGSCNRCFWPGTHRDRIINQLKIWRF